MARTSVIAFAFRENVTPERQEEIMKRIEGWPGVTRTERLDPDSSDPGIFRMCFAYLSGDVDSEAVSRTMVELPEIEYADEPPVRGLPKDS